MPHGYPPSEGFLAEQLNLQGDEINLRKVPLGSHDLEKMHLGSHGELDPRMMKQPEATIKD